MKSYQRDNGDKINSINRCFFDAEHGWITLALERLQELHHEFVNDPQIQYAEGLIRKDFLGQGIKAEECFLGAHKNSKDTSKNNETYLFSTFNSVKYARNLEEFQKQEKIVRDLDPHDRDLLLFDQINEQLTQAIDYSYILAGAAGQYQQHNKYGECAAMAELALQAGDFPLDDELGLRKSRLWALRELDKMADNSRTARGEGYIPDERLALQQAIEEIEIAIQLDPDDYMLWNFKSAWLYIMDKPEESITAAENSLTICHTGYVKPLTNKALALQKLGRKEEASNTAYEALRISQTLGPEGAVDREIAQHILDSIATPLLSDDDILKETSYRILNAATLTSRQELKQFKEYSGDGKGLLIGLKLRVLLAGKDWNMEYMKIMAQMLTYFCPETVWVTLGKLQGKKLIEYGHCLNALHYIAAHEDGAIRRDACRVLIFTYLGSYEIGTYETYLIRKCYREAVLGPTAVCSDGFFCLERNMRDEMARINPVLIKIVADQIPLNDDELKKAKNLPMARFIDGISRDTTPLSLDSSNTGISFLKRIFGNR